MTLLLLSSAIIATTSLGMAYCILNEGRCERQEQERMILIARLARFTLQDEPDMLGHPNAGR